MWPLDGFEFETPVLYASSTYIFCLTLDLSFKNTSLHSSKKKDVKSKGAKEKQNKTHVCLSYSFLSLSLSLSLFTHKHTHFQFRLTTRESGFFFFQRKWVMFIGVKCVRCSTVENASHMVTFTLRVRARAGKNTLECLRIGAQASSFSKCVSGQKKWEREREKPFHLQHRKEIHLCIAHTHSFTT
jgi:hypothetical protein